jgi:hypothetical protein
MEGLTDDREYEFYFQGGSKSQQNQNIKFHLFTLSEDGKEDILYQALKLGIIGRIEKNKYSTYYPYVKVFCKTDGFGIPNEYYSFFFKIEPTGKEVRISPLGESSLKRWGYTFYFKSRGRFLNRQEIHKLLGNSPSYGYYLRQAALSKRRIRELVHTEHLQPKITKQRVRAIRI